MILLQITWTRHTLSLQETNLTFAHTGLRNVVAENSEWYWKKDGGCQASSDKETFHQWYPHSLHWYLMTNQDEHRWGRHLWTATLRVCCKLNQNAISSSGSRKWAHLLPWVVLWSCSSISSVHLIISGIPPPYPLFISLTRLWSPRSGSIRPYTPSSQGGHMLTASINFAASSLVGSSRLPLAVFFSLCPISAGGM